MTIRCPSFVFILALSWAGFGDTAGPPETVAGEQAASPRIAPYESVSWNREYLNDVRVDEDRNIFIQLQPVHREKELAIRISNERFAGYRDWWHGGKVLVAPAGQGKRPYEWTDRVHSQARYIEYWMEGELILHLRRIE